MSKYVVIYKIKERKGYLDWQKLTLNIYEI
jgi:hypothetical protein